MSADGIIDPFGSVMLRTVTSSAQECRRRARLDVPVA